MTYRFLQTSFIILSLSILSGCGSDPVESPVAEVPASIVSARTIQESIHLPATISYPGTVTPEQDVKINATASGTASGISANLGDSVKAGQILMRIDDSNGAGAGSFNAAQVAQSQLAADQAKTSLDLAKKNYASLESSTKKDLEQAKANADQASRNIGHTGSTTDESSKAAELAYESAQLASEQAKSTLDNRASLIKQSEEDVTTNAFTTITTHSATASSIIDNINTMTGFDDDKIVDVPYKQNLGALDSQTKLTADTAYDKAKKSYNDYKAANCSDASDCLNRTAQILTTIKTAIDSTVAMLEKSISGSNLPENGVTGTSLSGLKSAAVGYQSQINAAISAINASKQAISNTVLNNKTTLDQLQKAYDLAKKQEASAQQNLNNLRTQTESQKDQVGTAASSAQSSYEGLNLKLESQLDGAKSQIAQAELSYQNSLLALQNLSNTRTITAPIDGTITKKEVAIGDAVNPGQLLFTVSKTGNVKVEIYIDDIHHALIKQGMQANITDNNKRAFKTTITRIAPQADPLTKRFLVELLPNGGQENFPLAGAIVDVALEVSYQPLDPNNFFVPLASVTIGQNESSIFTIVEGKAKRVPVTLVRVLGEYTELKADLPENTEIIFDGARTVSEGEKVKINK